MGAREVRSDLGGAAFMRSQIGIVPEQQKREPLGFKGQARRIVLDRMVHALEIIPLLPRRATTHVL